MWSDQLEALSDIRTCLAPDLPGFGQSDPAPDLTMERIADTLAGFIGPESADVIALSMGGYAALALWERHPEVVRSLALLDTRPGADSEEGRAGRKAAAEQVTEKGTASLVDGMTGALLASGASDSARRRLREMIEATSVEAVVAALGGMAARPDRTDLLQTISVPTLVLVGEQDRLTPPAEAENMAARIPGAVLVSIPGAGHLTPIEAPDRVSEALRSFLT
jgi:3-oxoadipate enol-lactonase